MNATECGEPYWPEPEPDHQHRCAILGTARHDIGTAPGVDCETEIHKCGCGFTWVVD